MAKIVFVHWNEAEAEARVKPLRDAGHQVRVHWSTVERLTVGDIAVEAVVISLDRLPSHGREIANWFASAKKRRGIPLVFSGGDVEKAKLAKGLFPRAHFCSTEAIVETLARVVAGA